MTVQLKGNAPILIVDDDEATAELERRALNRAGRQVRVARGLGEAITLLSRERFSAVLLDYKLPEGAGWPILDAARALVPRVPVIVVTAAGDERVAAEAIHRGAADYIIKTGDFVEQLPSVVALVLKLTQADEANAHLAAIVESSDDAIISGTLDGIIASWNPAAEALYGYSAAEVAGRSTAILVPPEKSGEVAEILQKIRRGQTVKNFETVRVRKDGTRIDVSVTISLSRDSLGHITAVSTIARDIAERRRAEALLRSAKEAAEAAVQAKGEFLANVSHELRTPMNGVLGMTSLLLDTPLSPEQREYVDTIRTSGGALLTIVNDILDYSKAEAGALELERQPFALRRCVMEAIELVAGQAAAKGLILDAHIHEQVPDALLGDVTRLRQVLVNLVANAVKFTDRGEVTVSVKPEPAVPPGATWKITVRDTGIGIPADRLDRLFRPFSQVDAGIARKYGGTGLGLAITRRLVEAMGGALNVASEVGRGSVFSFTFRAEPATLEDSGQGELGPTSSPFDSDFARRHPLRILIGEDNSVNQRVAVR